MGEKTVFSMRKLAVSVAASIVAVTISTSMTVGSAGAAPVAPAEVKTGYTASAATTKLVGQLGYTWGSFRTSGAITAWTEVLVGKTWSRSQSVKTDKTGYYVIPLTYGVNGAGKYRFRVRAQLSSGTIGATQEFTVTRVGPPSISAAPSKYVGAVTYAWGTFNQAGAIRVWTEVWAGGRWNRSQTGKTNSSGGYTLPLTYGANTPGTYGFRVRGEYPGGVVATSRQVNLKRVARVTKAQKAVAFAKAQIGDRYAYGGTGPNSWDCSGLTGGAWKAAGVALPRTSQQQYNAGRKVAKADLKPGDLIFYYSGRSHVGIYVGGGQIVHSSRPGTPVQQVSVNLMPYNGAVRPA